MEKLKFPWTKSCIFIWILLWRSCLSRWSLSECRSFVRTYAVWRWTWVSDYWRRPRVCDWHGSKWTHFRMSRLVVYKQSRRTLHFPWTNQENCRDARMILGLTSSWIQSLKVCHFDHEACPAWTRYDNRSRHGFRSVLGIK